MRRRRTRLSPWLRPRLQTGTGRPSGTVPASFGLCTVTATRLCYRSHSTLFLSASSQLPFKGIWIIIKVSHAHTCGHAIVFLLPYESPHVSGRAGLLGVCSQLWSIWAALRHHRWKPVSSGAVSQADRAPCRPTCTVSEGRGLSQSPLCPLKGKPSSRAYLKALLFIIGFDYEVLCVSGSCGLTELLGSVVLEFPSN